MRFLISNFRRFLKVLCFLLGNSPASEFYMPTFRNICLFHLHRPTRMEQSVPKRRHVQFRRRGIAQKKAYNEWDVFLFWMGDLSKDIELQKWFCLSSCLLPVIYMYIHIYTYIRTYIHTYIYTHSEYAEINIFILRQFSCIRTEILLIRWITYKSHFCLTFRSSLYWY